VSANRDPELDELFGEDPELGAFARKVHAVPHPSARVEPSAHFRIALRRQLMDEAYRLAAEPPAPWYRRLLAPQPMAWAGAGVGALLITFVAFTLATSPTKVNAVQVTSPEQNAQELALVKPIELDFTQPMDHSSVESALSIKPVMKLQYQWQGDTSVKITPVYGDLAPNTQYVVTVTTAAKTRSGQTLPQTTTVPFTTGAPTPAPTPAPSAQPTTTPALSDKHQVAPVGTPPARWDPTGSALYIVGPSGQLSIWQLTGGPGRPLATDGVGLVAVGPDGYAYVRGGQIVYSTVTVPGVQPIAVGFRPSGLVFATTSDVESATATRLFPLAETAQAADFSPVADHLVYRGASGLHMMDLTTGKDTVVGPATALGDWSPDGHRYAYANSDGVYTTDSTGAAPKLLAQTAGVTSVAWSPRNQLLLGSLSSLSQVNSDGTGLKKLEDGAFTQLQWSPSGNAVFTFRRNDTVWTAKDVSATQGGSGQTSSAGNQDDLINSFIEARKAQKTDVLSTLLDQVGLAALGRLTLISSDIPSQARSSVLLDEPGRAVIRIVTTKAGAGQTAVDDTLVIQRDASGKPLIHGLTETVRPSFGSGPEVRQITVSGGQVQVFFDSDLDSSTVPAGVTIKGVQMQTAYDQKQRMVTLTAPGGLNPGTTYDIEVSSALQDVSSRPAVPYELPFIGSSS
jgi:hypothetical protein